MEELLFNKMDESERAITQGKAQALHAIIHLPDELQTLKSIEEQEKEMLERVRKEKYEEV